MMLAEIVAAGMAFTCTPTHVWDGDGPIWCAEGPKIRLSGIAAREMGGTCRPGHPCPTASAQQARDHLVSLIGRKTGTASTGHILVQGAPLTCRSVGSGKGGRTAAWCSNERAGDLSRAMVNSGYAAKWDRYWQ
jgi:endonuclease YncB( thermonuclease family)